MIIFEKLRWKNFLSTGNSFTEVDLCAHKTTLVVGHNGAGKSTMLDALSFALFGKSHRNISKPQLVNTINNKDCVVEVEFTVSGSRFRIVRGIKPAIFEIYKNGMMINQDSHSKEYQKILETNILKLNHKSFHQIVVLGSSSFIPFMQLSAQHRRDVIEDLLDMNLFSKMNTIVKEKSGILKEKIKDIGYQIDVETNRIDTQRKYIADINKINKDMKSSKEDSISEIRQEIKTILNANSDLLLKIQHQGAIWPTRQDKLQRKQIQLNQYEHQFKTNIKTVVKEAQFFENNDNCPTCTQTIDAAVRQDKLEAATAKARELQKALAELNTQLQSTEADLTAASEMMETVRQWQNTMNNNNQTVVRLEVNIENLQREIDELSSTSGDASKAKLDLQSYIAQKDTLVERRLTLSDQYAYNQVIAEMLKDTGIKTKIVKQYLPAINKLVNQYLQVLDFFVSFHLDESFSETIRSRHRDNFSYDSFSEGEKQRIDLALLFTWRMIAKMKNSVSTNLLILDETFDSSLDYEGVDNLMKIIYTLGDDTNVFVISHKGDILDGKFAYKMEFFKDKNFSKIKGN